MGRPLGKRKKTKKPKAVTHGCSFPADTMELYYWLMQQENISAVIRAALYAYKRMWVVAR